MTNHRQPPTPQPSRPAASPAREKDDPSWAPESGDKPDAAQPQRDREPQRQPPGSAPQKTGTDRGSA